VVFAVRPLPPAAEHQHVDVAEQDRYRFGRVIANEAFDDQHPAVAGRGLAAVGQDLGRPGVIPVMQHVRQHVAVGPAGDTKKEVARGDLAPIGDSCGGQHSLCAGCYGRQLEQCALEMRMAAQDGREQGSPAATDVNDCADVGEVVAGGHGRGERCGPLGHRGVKDRGVRGMLGQEVEQGHLVGSVEAGLAGFEPGREARQLETLILRQDPSLDRQPPTRSQPPGQALAGPTREAPETRYAVNGELRIAYHIAGAGEPDIVFVPGLISHLDLWWDEPSTARFFRRLAALGRLIMFDKRDTGLSDRGPGDAPLEERMTDLEAVMDACGSHRAVLFGYSEGAPMSLLFAATHPERVTALILGSASARWKAGADYPCGRESATHFAAIEQLARHGWGTGASIEWYNQAAAGSARARQQMARWERMAVSRSALLRMLRLCHAVDVRSVLPAIHAPTLIIQRLDDRITPPCHGRYLAAHLPAARYFEQPGSHMLWAGDTDALFAQIEELLTGSSHQPRSDRMLCALMAANTAHTGSGDLPGSQPTSRDAYADAARDAIGAYGGRLLSRGDASLLATFDGPARAIGCARMLRDQVTGLGIQLCLGVHFGEVEFLDDGVRGITVDIAARLAALARPGETLASRTVKDLLAGSGISFIDRGTHYLPDIPDQWPVFAIGGPELSAPGSARPGRS
jgi:pimeloyl-ACP methyl ester carboxylesterase/class 3 adenylate cyclase